VTGLLGALDGDPTVDRSVDDAALVKAMLEVEAALARAAAAAGLVSAESAAAVTDTARGLDLDLEDLGRRAALSGTPVIPLVQALISAVPDNARDAVHMGATSQDIIDTALQLVARRALGPLLGHLDEAAEHAAHLASAHRDTLAVARTLSQPALPTTFGLRAAGWLAGLDTAAAELDRVWNTRLAVQLGGAAGTMAAYGADGLRVAAQLAGELGLSEPCLPWHTERSRVLALGAALGGAVAACGKIATDVILLSQAEVGEVAEAEPGSSSAMPHKRNPVLSVLVVAAARRAPGLVSTLLASGVHEQERATGSWHAEWPTLRELLRVAGGAAGRTAAVLAGLRVDPAAMRRNLDAAGPAVFSEALTGRLTPVLGRSAARDAIRRALDAAPGGGDELAAALRADAAVARAVTADEIVDLLRPAEYLGSTGALVDRALTAHARRTRGVEQP
jgi:3-carboxy-cis,cis-muconate cycloisomerase